MFDVALDALIEVVRSADPELGEKLRLWSVFMSQPFFQTEIAGTDWFYRARDQDRPEVAPLVDAIVVWCVEYGLRADWVADTVLRSLTVWKMNRRPRGSPWVAFRVRWRGSLSADEMRFTFEEEWEPSVETQSTAKRRKEKAFADQLAAFLDERSQLAGGRGFEPSPHQPAEIERDLRWTIRHQVLRESYTDIARNDALIKPESSGRKTVTAAIKKTAKLIGLTLREPDKGAATPSG